MNRFIKEESLSDSPTGSPTGSPTPSRTYSPTTSPRKRLRDEKNSFGFNYGSENEENSDGSDEEEFMRPQVFRVFKGTLDIDSDGDSSADDSLRTELLLGNNVSPDPVDGTISPSTNPTTSTDRLMTVGNPCRNFNFDWRPFPDPPIPPESRREMFSHNNVGPTIPYVDPYDIFVTIWDRQFVEHIATETNRYAQQVASQMLQYNRLHPNSRIGRWRDTTVDELYTYFAITIAMGVVVKSRIEEYWNATPDLFYTPGFSEHMSINRFIILNKCLHFANNADMCVQKLNPSEAKLFKIRPVLLHLNEKFQSIYNLHQNLALDESLLMWKGWLDNNQLIPDKEAGVGIKSYEICESQTGYLWRFEIHAHNLTPREHLQDPLKASTPAIVLRLIQGLENKGHTLWMDNYYNSPCLARHLKTLGFDCAGTLRTNRKFVPETLHNLTKQNMFPGQISGLTSGDVDIVIWRDNNRVATISTYHGDATTLVRGVIKPTLIADYNVMMGAVDKKDQMLVVYPIERKRTKVWYKKFFQRLLNTSVLNSYIIHRHSSSSPLTHRNFRIALVKSLLSKHCSPRPAASNPNKETKRVDVTHRLEQFPVRNHQRQRRVCFSCKKRVHTFCAGCKITACIGNCFVSIHR